ncbi:YtfJ family protein [Acerihabitans arboris]|uniref:YtfJ family protein n=1 Tax=Acerihabitans arboris TaxID=2691583 RepID=A0A845SEB7_9GAMM|nr:YtfJ family protein [Acerihabitans arboris]NDL61426.1 YtfJ family protein [Acerihabitans arboris]
MRCPLTLLLVVLLLPFGAPAHNLETGKPLPKVAIAEQGELLLKNEKFSYKFWDSSQLPGKIHLVLHIAAQASASEMNAAMIEALKKINLPAKYYQTTTIINENDALFGSGPSFARNWVENHKRIYPGSQFILDAHSSVLQAWHLQPKGSAIIVLDAKGRVRYVREGALSLEEIQQVSDLLHRLLPGGAT